MEQEQVGDGWQVKKIRAFASGFLRLPSIFQFSDFPRGLRHFPARWSIRPICPPANTTNLSPSVFGTNTGAGKSAVFSSERTMTVMRSLEARQLATIRNRLLAGGKTETAVLKRDVVDCQEALITANETLAELEEANANQRQRIVELEAENGRLYETINNLIGGLQAGEELP